jgi:mono/diheme cytochrome c family protein
MNSLPVTRTERYAGTRNKIAYLRKSGLAEQCKTLRFDLPRSGVYSENARYQNQPDTLGDKMANRWMFALLSVCFWIPAIANAQPAGDTPRGYLLYTTHCIACHNTKIHWRDKKLASDWGSLNAEVRRWQGLAGLQWRDDDVAEVAHYLNNLYYHYPENTR